MKSFFAAFLVGLLVFPLADLLPGADGPPFALSIRPREETVMAGHDVTLDIIVTNTSGKIISFTLFPPQVEYVLDVKEPDGQPALMTETGRNITRDAAEDMKTSPYIDMRGYRSITLLPGQIYNDAIKVDNMYYMWTPGIYSLKVRRPIPEHLGKGEVESNTVNVTITYNPIVERMGLGPRHP